MAEITGCSSPAGEKTMTEGPSSRRVARPRSVPAQQTSPLRNSWSCVECSQVFPVVVEDPSGIYGRPGPQSGSDAVMAVTTGTRIVQSIPHEPSLYQAERTDLSEFAHLPDSVEDGMGPLEKSPHMPVHRSTSTSSRKRNSVEMLSRDEYNFSRKSMRLDEIEEWTSSRTDEVGHDSSDPHVGFRTPMDSSRAFISDLPGLTWAPMPTLVPLVLHQSNVPDHVDAHGEKSGTANANNLGDEVREPLPNPQQPARAGVPSADDLRCGHVACTFVAANIAELSDHARLYNHRAFRCRYPGCTAKPQKSRTASLRHAAEHAMPEDLHCKYCGKDKFARSDSLKRHIRKKHASELEGEDEQYPSLCPHPDCPCAQPSRAFKSKAEHDKHMSGVHGVGKKNCPFCDRIGPQGFVYEKDLIRHITSKHPNDSLDEDRIEGRDSSFVGKLLENIAKLRVRRR